MQFTRALEVAPGDPITSRQYNSLAAAFNDRMRSGVGDPTWRLWWRSHSLVRYLCEDVTPLEAPVDDYWKYWNLVDPRTQIDFECAAGTRVANPLTLFHHGNDDYPGEPFIVNYAGAADVTTDEGAWLAGIAQRGAVSPAGSYNAPAREAAIQHRYLSWMGTATPFNKSWGGFIAGPARGIDLDLCFEGFSGTYQPTEYKFTAIKAGLGDLVFTPTCPGTGDEPLNIIGLDYGPTGFILWRLNGEIFQLSYDDYVEGPYSTGGKPYWSHGNLLEAMTTRFSGEFKGNTTQRAAAGYNVQNVGFDFQAFLTSQYQLAPAYAEEGPNLVAIYPEFSWLEARSAGQVAVCSEGGQSHAIHEGYVLAGYFAKAVGLAGDESVQYEILNGTEVLAAGTVTAATPTVLHWFAAPVQATVSVRLVTDLPASPAGLTITIAELQSYRPSIEDAYLVLRACSTSGDDLSTVDMTGEQYAESRQLWDKFRRWGCLASPHSLPVETNIESNPIFDTARRWFAENLRFVSREFGGDRTLLSYEVDSAGQTILRFNRYGYFAGRRYDMFKGIAPPDSAIASGSLLVGVEYIARGGAVTHNGAVYTDGQKFTAVATTFEASAGGTVWQVDGIITTAPAAGESNEWLLFLSSNVYRDAEASAFKPESYGDVIPFLGSRCLFTEASLIPYDTEDLYVHMTNKGSNLHVEAPSGYSYAASAHSYVNAGLNRSADADFFRSCPIYKPDYEIESATSEGTDNAVVVIKLKSRMQTTAAAPEMVGPDIGNWDVDGSGRLREDGAAPVYRTDENTLREYLLFQESDAICQRIKGDNAIYNSGADADGSCHPRFYFTRLMPKAHVDTPIDNDTVESTDTRCVADKLGWMHFVLAAMCEGYVDAHASGRDACPHAKLGDYYIYSLMQQVNGSLPFSVVASALDTTSGELTWDDSSGGPFVVQYRAVDQWGNDQRWYDEATVDSSPYTVADATKPHRVLLAVKGTYWFYPLSLEARGDPPWSQGPISNTIMYAEVFNQFAKAINLLTRARIELPLGVEYRELTYVKRNTQAPDWQNFTVGAGEDCPPETPVWSAEDGAAYIDANSGSLLLGPPVDATVPEEPTTVGSWLSLPPGATRECVRNVDFETDYIVISGVTYPRHKCSCEGGRLWPTFLGTATQYELRLDSTSPALEALPAALREHFTAFPTFQILSILTQRWTERDEDADPIVCSELTWTELSVTPHEETTETCEAIEWEQLKGGVIVGAPRMHDGLIWIWVTGTSTGSTYDMCLDGPSLIKSFQVSPGNMMVTIPLVDV